ncbi:MAG: type II secretion system F family protein [Planctomycetota bacterium]
MSEIDNNFNSTDAWSTGVPVVVSSDPGGQDTPPPAEPVSLARSSVKGRRVRIKRQELYNLTSQLAIMTRSGVDVSSAIKSMARQTKLPAVKQMLTTLHEELIDGRSFSSALKRFPGVFDDTYVASVAAGEASGDMRQVLERLARMQRNDIRLRASIRKVLIYPLILIVVSTMVLSGLVLFVLPQFAGVFEEFDTPLPFITQCLIDLSGELRGRWWLWGSLLCAAIGGLIAARRSDAGQRMIDRFMLFSPVLRNVTRSLLFGRACRLLGLMIESGVPLLESLGLAERAISNSVYKRLFRDLQDDVLNGRGITNALLESEFVPPAAAEMVVTGERTGSLGMVTQLVGEHYEEDGESKLRDLITLLEPAITVIMGAFVAIVVLAVLLPMFDIATFANK